MSYALIGADGRPYDSGRPGGLGGHRRNRIYGRLDCPGARAWIDKGHYVGQRVFFADEPAAIAAGYRPCARCLAARYAAWKQGEAWPDAGVDAPHADLGRCDSALLVRHFAARAVPGVERVEGDVHTRTLALAHGPAVVELVLRGDRAGLRVLAGDARDREAAADRCRRLLGLDFDAAPARAALARDELIGPLIRARPDLTVPGGAGTFEVAVRAVVSQQVSLAAARTILGRLAAAHGRPLGRHGDARLFPSPEALARADPAMLPMPRARARALVGMARAAAERELGRAELAALPGIGPWTVEYVAMRALGDRDAFPAGDLALSRALARLGDPSPERWRPWRAYAAQHLWASHSGGPAR